jgi:hypothetical protein
MTGNNAEKIPMVNVDEGYNKYVDEGYNNGIS